MLLFSRWDGLQHDKQYLNFLISSFLANTKNKLNVAFGNGIDIFAPKL